MIFDTVRSSASSIDIGHAAGSARSAQARRTHDNLQPDWSILRETDFSGVLSEWFSVAKAARTTQLPIDLDRALAFAG